MVERVMKNELANHERLTDDELIAEVRRLVTCECEATAPLIAVLAELDERRLYLAAGCSSLFTYCTQVLHLSEHAAYGRIEAARAARKWQFKVAFTVSRDTYEKLREAQDLLRHRVPNGDVAVIVDRALTLLLAELHQTKHAAVGRPRIQKASAVHSRHVPASVNRAVWERDQGRCAFVGTTGRCAERGFLEYHHVVPFADGGATVVANLELRCRAHNEYEAERWFGVAEVKERPVCEFNAV